MVKADNTDDNGSALEPEQFRKMFIGGLSMLTTDESLRAFYSQFGELVDCIVMRDSATKKSRGFGFVSFANREQVDAAMSARPHEIDGKTVDPKRAVPRELSARSEANVSAKRLYVSGVREDHTDEMFREYFNKYGAVEIIIDKDSGKPRGFAFVTFEDYDPVDKCVLEKSHMVNGYRCDVKKALSKEEMKRAQQSDRERTERGQRSRGYPSGGGGGGGWSGGSSRGAYGGGGGDWGGHAGGGWSGGGGGGAWGGGYGGGGGGGYGGGGYDPPGGWAGASGSGAWGGAATGGWGGGGGAAGGGGGGWGGAPAAGGPWQQPGGAPGDMTGGWGQPSGGSSYGGAAGGGYGGGRGGGY